MIGCAIAQAISRRCPTAAARVRSCGISGGKRGIKAGFLRVLRFPLPVLIPLNVPYTSIIKGWYNSGRRTKWTQSHLTLPHGTKRKYTKITGMIYQMWGGGCPVGSAREHKFLHG
jgi:hypothetical protein